MPGGRSGNNASRYPQNRVAIPAMDPGGRGRCCGRPSRRSRQRDRAPLRPGWQSGRLTAARPSVPAPPPAARDQSHAAGVLAPRGGPRDWRTRGHRPAPAPTRRAEPCGVRAVTFQLRSNAAASSASAWATGRQPTAASMVRYSAGVTRSARRNVSESKSSVSPAMPAPWLPTASGSLARPTCPQRPRSPSAFAAGRHCLSRG